MAASPINNKTAIISIDVLLNGTKMKATYDLQSVVTQSAINTISKATLTILLPSGESENKGFAISEAEDFVPGTKVTLKAGYESKTDTIFEGIIIRHGLNAMAGQRAQLVLHCQDKAVKLTVNRSINAFAEQTDSTIIGNLVDASGLKKDIDATSYRYPQLIQSGSTDWDFIVSRAEANGLLVYTEAGKVLVKKPLSSGSPNLEVTYGIDVFDFTGELDAGYQLPSVTASGYNFAHGGLVEAKSSEPTVNKQGNLTGKKMAEVLNVGDTAIPFTSPMEADELKGIAQGTLLRSRLAAMRGRVSFYGNATPKLNTLIKLSGFGDRFNGEALISSVRHTIRDGNWRTETGFGLSPDFHHQKHHLGSGNGSLLPSINGLQNGVVKQLHEDPDGEHRVLVTVPVLGVDIWSRLGGNYAGNGFGSFFLPEVGNEVIVGFLNDDPRFAIILGSVYSSKNAPAYTADDKNSIKAITTRSQLKVELNDDKKIVTVSTPAGNAVVLSDEDKSIVMTDQNGNKIALEPAGITIKSTKDITIDATGKMTIKATQNIGASSSGGDISLKGINVNGDASLGVKMKGGTTAELSASGQTTVKGAMVMIN